MGRGEFLCTALDPTHAVLIKGFLMLGVSVRGVALETVWSMSEKKNGFSLHTCIDLGDFGLKFMGLVGLFMMSKWCI